jgi:hypothetical protein
MAPKQTPDDERFVKLYELKAFISSNTAEHTAIIKQLTGVNESLIDIKKDVKGVATIEYVDNSIKQAMDTVDLKFGPTKKSMNKLAWTIVGGIINIVIPAIFYILSFGNIGGQK